MKWQHTAIYVTKHSSVAYVVIRLLHFGFYRMLFLLTHNTHCTVNVLYEILKKNFFNTRVKKKKSWIYY